MGLILLSIGISVMGLLCIFRPLRYLLTCLHLGCFGRIVTGTSNGAVDGNTHAHFQHKASTYQAQGFGEGSAGPRQGESVQVAYNPLKPTRSVILSATDFVFALIVLLMGLAIVLVGQMIWVYPKYHQALTDWSPVLEGLLGTSLCTFMILMGLLCGLTNLSALRRRYRLRRTGLTATATAISYQRSWDQEETVVVFTFDHDGKQHIATGDIAGPGQPRLGRTVCIAYDPDNPDNVVLLTFFEFIIPAIMFLFGCLLVVAGIAGFIAGIFSLIVD